MKELFITIFILFFITGCSVKYKNEHLNEEKIFTKQMQNLYLLVQASSNKIDKKEAKLFAFEAITYSKKLAKEYEVIAPALFHNSLINLGLKNKGYCYHYANDLKSYLDFKKFKSFKLLKIVSKRGEYFEHTSLILTRDDIEFKNAIVLDAWRNSGKLYFAKIKDDKKYDWEIK